VTDNETEGIWLEVVCGATVRGNTSERNGLGGTQHTHWASPAGIQIVNGSDIEIHGNTVVNNMNGIAVLAAKDYPPSDCGNDLRNVYVHDNVVTMSQGLTGLAQNYGDKSYFTDRDNRFENNSYVLGTESEYFIWDDRRMTAAEWRAAGHDTGGSFTP
jgi:hypothetical protein